MNRKALLAEFPAADQTICRANAVLGDALIGIVVFGSWARGELAESSDVDVLMVGALSVPIRRVLYRRWDEQPIYWKRHRIEPHFVHLPDGTCAPSGFWAEIAVDGRVLVDTRGQVAGYLTSVRQAVADGELRRGTVHGHGYWVAG